MEIEKKMKREIWDIIASSLDGTLEDTSEQQELDSWIRKEENMIKYEEAKLTFRKSKTYFEIKNINTDSAWDKVNRSLPTTRGKQYFFQHKWVYQIAAVGTILLIATFTYWLLRIENTDVKKFITAQNDMSRPVITLVDGTHVSLNYGSQLIYPKTFDKNIREVKLIGEAFFDVAPNKQQPFIIKTNGASIKVVGTSFDVMAYEGSETTEVKVKTGKVEVYDESSLAQVGSRLVILFPGEMGIYTKTTKQLVKHTTYDQNSISWFTQHLEFDTTPLFQVIETLEQTFNIDVTTSTSVDLNKTISAKFEQQQLNYILNVIGITLGLQFEEKGDRKFYAQHK